jgi:superfamily II DNA or RNA helicase
LCNMTKIYQEVELNNTPRIKTTKVVYPQVYSYTLPDLSANDGSQKIGYTERKDVDERIREQTHTAAFQLKADKLWSAPAFFANSQQDFSDKTFHKFLTKSSVENRSDLGTEWFYFNGTPEKSKQLFDAFRDQGFKALQGKGNKIPYTLRIEQQQAVEQAKNYFDNHENGEFLWNAKPRFGKTLASYDLAKILDAKKVLIVTNRPAIANSWFDDFEMFIDGYYFISETSSLADRPAITRQQYISTSIDQPQITFLSLQDLKGSKYFGGSHNKLQWIANLEWDLLVIDEAHEGIDTSRTDAAFNIINRKHTLHLSGTPFKALANNKFAKEAIFNWTYLDEQKIKHAELEENETGDHTDLPNLRLYTYRISQMTADEVNEGIEIDDENRDFAFDLNEFFSTKNQKFVREDDVKAFLKNLTTNAKYPFSSPELRDQLRHTFWYVGNRVDSVKALEQLLKTDEIFKDYKVIVAAGDGKSFDEEEIDFAANEKSYDKVKKAIKENPKTITLTCGQLTTGVTIKEWSAVLMLTDIKTPAQYMQAAFRAQNPYKFYESDELNVKESAYLFDFAPTRVLEIYDQFANALNPKAVNGEITEAERKKNIKELLNYFPVISEDVNGQMVELDAEKVLTFPNALAATEIVKARFMTNLLFNDNIKNVFHFPKEIEDILDKMPIEKNKRAEVTKKELDLDDARKLEQSKQPKINENSGVILGEKIYRTNIERVVDNALDTETPDETLETLPDKVSELAEPVIAKYKEIYKATNAEIDEVRKDTEEKIKLVVAEYENAEIKDVAILKENLAKIIEHDFVETKVEQQETAAVEDVQKTKEDEVRDHLRAFTRTIPMFIMANSAKEGITIDNFDLEISDTDFVDLTSITKEEFHMLRDGFDYEEDGERKTFGGVFDRYKFNASIAEFVVERKKRADYFNSEIDIFELIPNQKTNQIFTPKRVVKMMLDGLEAEQPELFTSTDSTFIDLYMKSGLYITEIVKKLYINTRSQYATDTDCIKYILENQVYGLTPTGILHAITNSFIFGFDNNQQISTENFVMHDLLPEAKDGKVATKLTELYNQGGDMIKFDAVVGNPPYQSGTDTNFATPVYHLFFEAAKALGPNYISLIHPARFLFNAGATPKEWNKQMLNDPHLSVQLYEPNSQKIFSGVDIKGGVCITLWDKNQTNGGLGGSYIAYEELQSILAKTKIGGFDEIVGPRGETKLTVVLDKKYPNDLRIAPNYFDRFPEVFIKSPDSKHNIKIVGLEKGNKRTERYVDSSIVTDPKLNNWKVFIPKSNGSGAIGEVMSTPLTGEPLTGCTYSFLQIGSFTSKSEAQNCMKYIKSKFCRAVLGTLKVTQDNPKSVWKNVPLQNFTDKSDIDWSQSIANIDKQLYAKYDLNEDEVNFIETHVKAMG